MLPAANVHGCLVDAIARVGFVDATIATWDYTVFAVRGRRTVYVTVLRPELASFVADLGNGDLDDFMRHALAAPPGDRVLHTHAQALERAVFDEIQPSAALAAPERDSDGRPAVATVRVGLDPATSSRAGKAPVYVAPQSFVPGGGRRTRLWMLVALLAVLLVGGVAAGLATARDDDSTVATATTEPPPLTTAGGVASIAPGPTVASTTLAPLPSVVIRTMFVRPVTTYTVVISGAAPSFTYAWRLIGNETGTSATMRFLCRFQGAAEAEQSCTVTRQ